MSKIGCRRTIPTRFARGGKSSRRVSLAESTGAFGKETTPLEPSPVKQSKPTDHFPQNKHQSNKHRAGAIAVIRRLT
ncbi:MAG: hypothetical protein GY820_03755 [Gammaproteobacteria bacterium]|nr:hypothetical protein [Gammaproteobacteria bacterium]